MPRVILFNKPFGVLSQFTSAHGRKGLGAYLDVPGFYAAGRLDADSEGLLVLSDRGDIQQRIAHPRFKLAKVYLAQVEGRPDADALLRLARGIELRDGSTRPARARLVAEPAWLWPREPPVRYRASVPTSWLEITLREGRNRQVRRMTAAVGHPTLRLIRVAVGSLRLEDLAPGRWRYVELEPGALEPRADGPPRRRLHARAPRARG